MAFLTSESPNVTIKEIDLSGVVPAVTSSTGAFVGDFSWGPINQPILVGNEVELVETFGSPEFSEDSASENFLSAAHFLKYSGSLFVVRGAGASALNASDSGDSAVQIKNRDDWDTLKSGLTSDFYAKYAGEAGNSLAVSYVGADSAGAVTSKFDDWTYASSFDAEPGTSEYVRTRSADSALARDEVHVAIIDEDGVFTGVRGTVLETFSNVSLATDAKTADGTTNYILDVLNDRSSYVWAANVPTTLTSTPKTATEFTTTTPAAAGTISLAEGTDAGSLSLGDYQTGWQEFEDETTIQVDLMIMPGLSVTESQKTLVNELTGYATARKDCVVVCSPPRQLVVGVNNPTTINTSVSVDWAKSAGVSASSYLVMDNNYLKVYNKYKDRYEFIPASAGTAGTMAATDDVAAPWFSPAGGRRGGYRGVTSLAYNPTKSQRDTLYKAGVNPVVNLPGQGILLYGDKTFLNKPSAFNRINVRRLFLVMERAIKGAAQNVLFEFNDEFTRAEFVNIVEPFLREIKGRRGISDFRVVCDETNNTSDIIDNNQFVASVFVKPARSINYVTLNFVAVRTGVDFDEVVGIV